MKSITCTMRQVLSYRKPPIQQGEGNHHRLSGGFVYENNTLEYFPFSEGRVRKQGSDWRYEYDLKDHLGNVRATFTETAV